MLTKRALNCLPVNQEARIGCFNDTKKTNNNNNNNNNNNKNNNNNNNNNNNKGSSMPKPCHGSETEPHSHSPDLRWFVFEALGQKECHVTMVFFIDLLILSYVFLSGSWYGK